MAAHKLAKWRHVFHRSVGRPDNLSSAKVYRTLWASPHTPWHTCSADIGCGGEGVFTRACQGPASCASPQVFVRIAKMEVAGALSKTRHGELSSRMA